MDEYEYKTEFARTYYSKGLADGYAQARVEAYAQECAEGYVHGLLAVMDARGLVISAQIRERVLGWSDVKKLECWLVRAATAQEAHEVLYDLP